MFRAILFDLDNTLIDRDGAYKRYTLDFMARHDRIFPKKKREELFRELAAFDDSGYRERAEYCAFVATRFPKLKLTAEQVWEDYQAGVPPFVEPCPAATRELERISGRYALALVTNGSGKSQRAKVERLGLEKLIPHIFISGEIGIAKPHPGIFARALEAVGCKPGEALMVGDDPDRDVGGALGAGIPSCWISIGRPFPPNLPPPSYTIPGIDALSQVVA